MKRIWGSILLIMLMVTLVACQSEEPVGFSDDQLEHVLREEIGKSDGEIYINDFDELTELDLSSKGITDLTGIEELDQLKTINLEGNEIANLSPLSEIDGLEEISISANQISDEQQIVLDDLSKNNVNVNVVQQEEDMAVAPSPDGPGGFLWKVTNGGTTVYLQGTIHVGVDELFPLNEAIENAYTDSDVVVPEIDIVNVDLMESQSLLLEYGLYQDGTTVKDHIPEELYKELELTFAEYGMPMHLMEMYKPWMLSSTVQQLMLEKLDYIYGVDEYFLTRAHEDEKEVIALESVEEQFSIFAETSQDYQIQMLEESLVDIEDFDNDMKELLELYMQGDIDPMLDSLVEEDHEMTEDEQLFMEALNDQRNQNMAEKIIGFLEEDNGKTYFVIVGALHYLMEPHIRTILEEKGYVVEHIL